MAQILTSGVGYAQFIDDLRAVVRHEVEQAIGATPPARTAPEIGGIELAQEITRLSKARIYTLVSERVLPHSKRGNRLTFSRTALLAWVAAGHRAETTTTGKEGRSRG